jgi:hypothetical protein
LLNPEGYCVHREFYVPPFDVSDTMNLSDANKPKTIYWNPSIVTNQYGKASIPFVLSNANKTSNYSIIVEGIGFKSGFGYGFKFVNILDSFSSRIGNEEIKELNNKIKRNKGNFQANILTSEEIKEYKCRDIYCLLQHLNGVRVVGKKIFIRSSFSFNSGSSPLIIINGIPGSLEMIDNVDLIKKIVVEKDGNIYGVRGSNGVIEIVTK